MFYKPEDQLHAVEVNQTSGKRQESCRKRNMLNQPKEGEEESNLLLDMFLINIVPIQPKFDDVNIDN